MVHCVFRGNRGTKIILRHGELPSEGKLHTENLRKAERTDTYILSGEGEETFRPLFTFHGFRYFTVEIIGNAEILALTAEAMYSDLPSTGDSVCSDESLPSYIRTHYGASGTFSLTSPPLSPTR